MRRFLVWSVAVLVFAPPAQAAVRYATPIPAAGATCAVDSPCSLSAAFDNAAEGDTVLVGTGTYAGPGSLDDHGKDVSLRGAVVGSGRPVLSNWRVYLSAGSSAQDLTLTISGDTALQVSPGATAARILATRTDGDPCGVGGTLTDSVCNMQSATAGGGSGVSVTGGVLRNVTSVGRDYGVYLGSGTPTLTNSAFFGGSSDVFVFANSTLSHDAYDTMDGGFANSTAKVARLIQRTAYTDMRQASNSPTIDAGDDASATGAQYDLNGNLRKIGAHVDIGAYEHVEASPTSTDGADPTSTTSATVQDFVNGFGGALTFHVTYGTSDCTGTTSANEYEPGSAQVTQLHHTLTGLQPDTIYFYCLVVSNDHGVFVSPQRSFTTKRVAPVATVSEATAVTSTTATLHGAVDLPAGVTVDASFELTPEGGATSTLGTRSVSADGPLTANATGLSPNTKYTYRVIVGDVGNGGGTAQSATSSFTTPPDPPEATGGEATKVTATTATLGGTVDTKGAPGTARFIYGSASTADQSTSGGPVSADLTGLAPNTTYQWKVRIQTTGGLVESPVKTFTTLPEAPGSTTGEATNLTPTGARLTGVADTQGVQGTVAMLVDGIAVGEATQGSGPFFVDVTGLAPGSTHTYRLRVITGGGSALGEVKAFSTLATGTPTPTPTPTPTATGVALKLADVLVKGRLPLKSGKVTAIATCTGVGCAVSAGGVVKSGKKTLGRLKPAAATVAANQSAPLAMGVPKKLRKRLPARARITITAVFSSGSGTLTRKLSFPVLRPSRS